MDVSMQVGQEDEQARITNKAIEWQQTACFEHFMKIYKPHLGLGGDPKTIPEGIEGLKAKMEPTLKNLLAQSGGNFIGGTTPSIADYRCPVAKWHPSSLP